MCAVLFCDVAGFTPLAEARDPEAVRELLSEYFGVARTVVGRYGGVLRDVDHEDVRDADLGDVLAAESPAGRVRRGWVVLGLSRVVLRVSR